MKIFKLLLLLLAIIVIDNNVLYIKTHVFSEAYASDPTLNGDQYVLSDKASAPKCGISSIVAATVASALAISIAGLVIAVIVSATAPWMAWMIAASIAAIALTITENMLFFACKYSFVRHPVLRFLDGSYKTCTNPKLLNVSDDENSAIIEVCPDFQFSGGGGYEWPKNKAPYSNYIELCSRPALGGLCTGSDCASRLDPRERETSLDVLEMKSRTGGALKCITLKDGQKATLGGVTFKASYNGDKICVNAWGLGSASWWPQPEIGCHLREPSPPAPMCSKSVAIKDNEGKITGYDNFECFSCYVSAACYGEAGVFSHAPMAMTSTVVQCLKESLSSILIGCNTQKAQVGFLETAKIYLTNTVKAAIALALILFGIKLMLGAVQNMAEVGMLFIKIALVFYFCIGGGMNFYYKELVSLSTGLSDIVFQAGGNQTICNYKSSDYNSPVVISGQVLDDTEKKIYREIIRANTYNSFDAIMADQQNLETGSTITPTQFSAFLSKLELKDFSYLAIWDRLDCRIGFYLGQSVSQGLGFSLLSLIIMPLAFLFAGQILFTIAILFFIIMMLIMVLWIVHIFILSLIALTIICLFAPLFVPMCLFQVTKGFFDGWLKELVAYSLYPVVLFAFMGLVFSVFDTLYFEDLTFKKIQTINNRSIRSVYNFTLDPESQCDNKTTNLACIVSKSNFITKPLIFGINVTAVNVWGDSATLWKTFLMMAVMAFLFYHFLGILGSFAAELVGSFRADFSRSAMSASDMGKKALAGAIGAGKGIKSRVSSMGKKDGEDKKEDKKREGVSGGSK